MQMQNEQMGERSASSGGIPKTSKDSEQNKFLQGIRSDAGTKILFVK